jgi:hypothetical protein
MNCVPQYSRQRELEDVFPTTYTVARFILAVEVKKVKFALEQAMKAQRVRRSTALLFL